jgi:hypothetical protein
MQGRIAPLNCDGRGRNYLRYGATLNLCSPRDFTLHAQLGAAPPGGVGQPKALQGLRKDFVF